MIHHDPVVILKAQRTPMGGFLGLFSSESAWKLGGHVLKACMSGFSDAQTDYLKSDIDACLMGCVLMAGQGQAPARQAMRFAGVPDRVSAVTLNKMCGSGMQSVMDAYHGILAGCYTAVLAGGMENMSMSPFLLPSGRKGHKFGHQTLCDHMLLDGLEDAYHKSKVMGWFAEEAAKKFSISRAAQDAFSIRSFESAIKANESNAFKDEITPVTLQANKVGEPIVIDKDEPPFKSDIKRIPTLKTVFQDGGTITAGNASSLSDGAAALFLARESWALQHGFTPLGKILGVTSVGVLPELFPEAPVGSIQKLLKNANLTIDNINLFEINEAFAVVPLIAMQGLGISENKVNIRGGACALGHPLGASGARVIVTLLHALRARGGGRGVAALCVGGGEGISLALEV
jgi:acetyl-CoA C-acetyltransferase